MSDRELDSWIHLNVMGQVWPEDRCRICGWPLSRDTPELCSPTNCSMRPAPKKRADEPPHYTTDHNDAARVRARIAELGDEMVAQFEYGLQNLLVDEHKGTGRVRRFEWVNASPKQQMEAAFAAWEARNG